MASAQLDPPSFLSSAHVHARLSGASLRARIGKQPRLSGDEIGRAALSGALQKSANAA